MILKAATVLALLATASIAWEQDVDCTSTQVDAPEGLLYAFDSEGNDIYCDEVGDAKTSGGVTCYRTSGNSDSLGLKVKCPSDPPPSKNPDGSDAEEIADGLVTTYCDTAGDPFVFVNVIGCLLFAYYEANGNPVAEEEAGARAVCDTIFSGACTFFIDVAPDVADGMDRACIDDPGSHACDFANPGK